jgi:hypothetical protein
MSPRTRLRCRSSRNGTSTGRSLGSPAPFPLAPVILTEFTDFVVVAKVAMVAIFPNVASVAIEERVVTPAAIYRFSIVTNCRCGTCRPGREQGGTRRTMSRAAGQKGRVPGPAVRPGKFRISDAAFAFWRR